MKKYLEPILEMMLLNNNDVLTSSVEDDNYVDYDVIINGSEFLTNHFSN